MDEQMITITVKEYKKLLETYVRVSAFSDFVKEESYNIDKKDCARYLGFEINDDDEED